MNGRDTARIEYAAPSDSDAYDSIARWVSVNIGGTVTAVERLRRWRPVWRVDYEKGGATRALLLKSLRAWDAIPYSLEHELRVMQVLERNGIGVPHVYGMLDHPRAIAMEWVEGDRDPGLVRHAVEGASAMTDERWSASLKYMEVLAQMHRIPVAQFVETEAGFPVGAREIALAHFERNYDLLAKHGAVDALVEFFALWLRRNVPAHRVTATFITGDCGQFLSKGNEITAILDLEIAHLGDPLHDLACFRGRHPVENMGDVPALFRRYAQITGEPLDLPVIAYHTVAFLAMATIGPMIAMADTTHPGGDWVEGVGQLAFIARRTLDAIAEIVGVELDDVHDIALPPPHVTPLEDQAIDKLVLELSRLETTTDFPPWQRDVLISLPGFLRNQAHYGRWVEEEDLREAGELLGSCPSDLSEADAKLKAFVQAADVEQDATLVRLFHRRIARLCRRLAGPDAPKDHLLFIKVDPILKMDTHEAGHAAAP